MGKWIGKRVLTGLLAFAMIATSLPSYAYAAEVPEAEPEEVAEAEVLEEAEVPEDAEEVEDLLPIGEPVNSDDLYDDFEDDELDGLTGAENLDEILDREGIDISDGDTVGNIMEMFGAGFSIIEISKVLKLEVSEVKEIIDKEQG